LQNNIKVAHATAIPQTYFKGKGPNGGVIDGIPIISANLVSTRINYNNLFFTVDVSRAQKPSNAFDGSDADGLQSQVLVEQVSLSRSVPPLPHVFVGRFKFSGEDPKPQ
jgi:hypothetical protein